jgi:hypothetical protein
LIKESFMAPDTAHFGKYGPVTILNILVLVIALLFVSQPALRLASNPGVSPADALTGSRTTLAGAGWLPIAGNWNGALSAMPAYPVATAAPTQPAQPAQPAAPTFVPSRK